MELHVTLDPNQLARLKAQPILKSCQRGRMRTSRSEGEFRRPASDRAFDASPALSFRLTRSSCELGGASWCAELRIEAGDANLPNRPVRRFCLVSIRLVEGAPHALEELLNGLAARVPLCPTLATAWHELDILWSKPATPIKAKPPRLQAEDSRVSALRCILAGARAQLVANHECLRETGDPEAIHQMRVALRRLRSAIVLFKSLLNDPRSQTMREELRWMLRLLGGARDGDVLMAEILPPLEGMTSRLPGFDGLQRQVALLQSQARDRMMTELSKPRFVMAMVRLAFWCAEAGAGHSDSDAPVRALARRLLVRRYRRLRHRMAHFAVLEPAAQHECRLYVKKLRYALEFFSGLLDSRRTQHFIAQLSVLQEHLGTMNDIATAHALLQSIALQSGAHEIAWAAGLVTGWHKRRSSELQAQVVRDWQSLGKLPHVA